MIIRIMYRVRIFNVPSISYKSQEIIKLYIYLKIPQYVICNLIAQKVLGRSLHQGFPSQIIEIFKRSQCWLNTWLVDCS